MPEVEADSVEEGSVEAAMVEEVQAGSRASSSTATAGDRKVIFRSLLDRARLLSRCFGFIFTLLISYCSLSLLFYIVFFTLPFCTVFCINRAYERTMVISTSPCAALSVQIIRAKRN